MVVNPDRMPVSQVMRPRRSRSMKCPCRRLRSTPGLFSPLATNPSPQTTPNISKAILLQVRLCESKHRLCSPAIPKAHDPRAGAGVPPHIESISTTTNKAQDQWLRSMYLARVPTIHIRIENNRPRIKL